MLFLGERAKPRESTTGVCNPRGLPVVEVCPRRGHVLPQDAVGMCPPPQDAVGMCYPKLAAHHSLVSKQPGMVKFLSGNHPHRYDQINGNKHG